jgi:SAM-dependent methyltransferase
MGNQAMRVVERLHGSYVHSRRVQVLCSHLASMIPQGSKTLDVGCGDGLLAHLIAQSRPDVEMIGIDTLVRTKSHIQVLPFDGRVIPYDTASCDTVMFVDVLHHTDDPMILLREAARVARESIVIKDHLREGVLAGPTLRVMDWVSNAPHGVALTYNYWALQQWREAFDTLRLTIGAWQTDLNLYPPPNKVQAPGTSYNLEFLSPTFKTLTYQPALRGDYQFSSALRVTAKFSQSLLG